MARLQALGAVTLMLLCASVASAAKETPKNLKNLAKKLQDLDVEGARDNVKKAFSMIREAYDVEATQFSAKIQSKLARHTTIDRGTLFLVLVCIILVATAVGYVLVARRKRQAKKQQ